MKLEELIESFVAKRQMRVVLVAIPVLFCSSTHSIGNVMLYLYQRLGGGFKYLFVVTPIWGKIPILTNIFQIGWNHQLEDISSQETILTNFKKEKTKFQKEPIVTGASTGQRSRIPALYGPAKYRQIQKKGELLTPEFGVAAAPDMEKRLPTATIASTSTGTAN